MTDPLYEYPQQWPPPAAQPATGKKWAIAGFVTALVLVGGGVGVYLFVTQRDSEPKAFSIRGNLFLNSTSIFTGKNCHGTGGYHDISPGTEVTVSDDAGTLMAKGKLDSGFGEQGQCVLPFRVDDVPGGKKFYKIEVAHRGQLSYTEAEAKAGLSLQLGESSPEIATTSPTPTRTKAASPSASKPAPPAPIGAVALPVTGGNAYIVTKSGKTNCRISASEVDCQAAFTNSPIINGFKANGVAFRADGAVQWVVGDLGEIPAVGIDYRTYRALGWTITASFEGTSFTNDATGNGIFVSIDTVTTY